MSSSSFASHASAIALCLLGALSVLPVACSSTPKAKEEKECTPGAYVFCRCRDRQEGAKLCKEDAKSFGPCEPCETADNPEGELNPGEQPKPVQKDGGPIENDSGQPNPNGSCGDGVVQNGEDCDDKNGDSADGCDSTCTLSGTAPPLSNSCPGVPVHVWGGAHRPTLVANTNGSNNHRITPPCTDGSTTGAVATDRVFQVVAHKTGMMTVVTSETNFNNFIYVSDACAPDQNTWLKCANEASGQSGESMTFAVTSGVTYYVFVDGAGTPNAGTFRVTFAIP